MPHEMLGKENDQIRVSIHCCKEEEGFAEPLCERCPCPLCNQAGKL